MLHCSERKQKWKMRRLILNKWTDARSGKQQGKRKWILWVNNLKRIEKQNKQTNIKKTKKTTKTTESSQYTQTASLHQSGAGINQLLKVFCFFFFFLNKWKLKMNFSLQFCSIPACGWQVGWSCDAESPEEPEQGFSIFWMLCWFLKKMQLYCWASGWFRIDMRRKVFTLRVVH